MNKVALNRLTIRVQHDRNCLLAHIVGRDLLRPRFRHLDVVPEDGVVADLQILYSRAFPLGVLEVRDPLLPFLGR